MRDPTNPFQDRGEVRRVLDVLADSVDWIERLCLSEDIDPQHIRAGIGIEGETLASALATFRSVIATGSPDGR